MKKKCTHSYCVIIASIEIKAILNYHATFVNTHPWNSSLASNTFFSISPYFHKLNAHTEWVLYTVYGVHHICSRLWFPNRVIYVYFVIQSLIANYAVRSVLNIFSNGLLWAHIERSVGRLVGWMRSLTNIMISIDFVQRILTTSQHPVIPVQAIPNHAKPSWIEPNRTEPKRIEPNPAKAKAKVKSLVAKAVVHLFVALWPLCAPHHGECLSHRSQSRWVSLLSVGYFSAYCFDFSRILYFCSTW